MNEVVEEWRWIVGYEGLYQVSNLGEVKSFYFGKEKIKQKSIVKCYYQIGLIKDGKRKCFYVHQLVAQAFLGHVIDGYTMVVNHISLDKLNNRIDNLEIKTQRENSSTCARIDRDTMSSPLPGAVWNKRNKNWASKIKFKKHNYHLGYFNTAMEAHLKWKEATEAINKGTFENYILQFKNYNKSGINQFNKDCELIREWNSLTEIENTLFICLPNIIKCCKGERNFAGGFKWSYKEKEED